MPSDPERFFEFNQSNEDGDEADELTKSVIESPDSPWQATADAQTTEVAVVELESTEETPEEETVELAEILFQYRHAILDLDARVSELEKRPQFASSIKTKIHRV